MKILFLGDSITDTGRNTNSGSTISIGQGYAMLVDARLSVKYPGEYSFVNAGISGDRLPDLYARMDSHVWNEKPDLVSILVGINDVWHEIDHRALFDTVRFEQIYRMAIADTKRRLPGVRLLLMEPFVLRTPEREAVWDELWAKTRQCAEIVRRVAEDTDCLFLPLQQTFDDACALCPPAYWIADGVHPTPAGHQLIADAWIRLFEEKIR